MCGGKSSRRKGKTRGGEKWLELTLHLRAGKRRDCSCGQAISVVAILKRALPMRGGVTWMRQEGSEGARERTDCSRQALGASCLGVF